MFIKEAGLLTAGIGLNAEGFAVAGVAANGEARGFVTLAKKLTGGFPGDCALFGDNIFSSRMPGVAGACSDFSRMLWNTLDVTLRPLVVAALLVWLSCASSSVGLSRVICTSAFLLPRGVGEGGASESWPKRDDDGGGALGVVLPLMGG